MIMRKTIQRILPFAAMLLLATCFTGCSAKIRSARHQRLGDKYFAEENYSKAEIEYLIALRLDNANSHTISKLADIYFQQGRMRRAYAFTWKATQMATNDVDMHVQLAIIYLAAHSLKDAHKEAEWVLAKSPTNAL